MKIPVYKEPSREERERDYDSFRIDDQKFDVFSFDEQPFSLSALGHRWLFEEEYSRDFQVITNRNPTDRLAKTKEPLTAFIQSNHQNPDHLWENTKEVSDLFRY